MGELAFSIDITWYDLKKEDSFFVEGWAAAPQAEPVRIFARSKDRILECEVCWKERPDIFEVRKDLKLPSKPGFTLRLPGVSGWIRNPEGIEIFGEYKENVCLLQKFSAEKLRSCVADCTILYEVDIVQFLGTELQLQGWFVDQCQVDRIRILDGAGREIPADVRRISRQDVQDRYGEYTGPDGRAGFVIRVAKKDMTDRYVRVCFCSRDVQKEYKVDMRRMERNLTQRGRMLNVLGPEKWKENLEFIRENGFSRFQERIREEIYLGMAPYSDWVKRHRLTPAQAEQQKRHSFSFRPKISIVIPLYETPEKYLKEMLDSIVKQTYDNWELCLADGSPTDRLGRFVRARFRKDPRIRYCHLEENRGISGNTNAAVQMASGDYIMLCDHDDLVEQGALYEIVKALNEDPDLDILYTDEDKISMDGKSYFEPNFKTDFNPFMLESNNYICHIFVVRKTIMDRIGGFRKEFDGAQDFDLILRCWETAQEGKICHIPKVLYHWRSHPNSTATNPESKRYAYEAGARALDEHFARIGTPARAEITQNLGFYRIHREIAGEPRVSVIIPNKDHVEDLEKCLCSVYEKSTYRNFEVLIVENNSTEDRTFAFYETLPGRYENCRVLFWEGEFNYAAINNYAAQKAAGEYLLFLNNDVEVIAENWMEEMLGICQLPQVGAVGAKLYYPDKTIQHAGIVIGMGGLAGHMLTGTFGYVGRSTMPQNLSAVTAACMMVPAAVFREVEGFDEKFRVAYNDVDLCMKLTEKKYQVVFTPYAELYHYESRSRGPEDTEQKRRRLSGEAERFREKWPEILEKGDPYYNPNLSLEDGSGSLKEERRKQI